MQKLSQAPIVNRSTNQTTRQFLTYQLGLIIGKKVKINNEHNLIFCTIFDKKCYILNHFQNSFTCVINLS